jgi:hypothetical protein
LDRALSVDESHQTRASFSRAFHQRQWGAEFNISGGFFSAGALRFTSPAHAWLVDLGAGYAHTSVNGPAGSTTGNNTNIVVELGSRSYHPFGRRLYRLTTFGVSFNYNRQSTSGGTTFQAAGGGVFGDLGATWLVTPHLGIGARWRVAASYVHASDSSAGVTTTGNGVTFSVGTLQLTGQLYF